MDAIMIDGRQLTFSYSGRGSPTVILETGLGVESSEWEAVEREVAAVARVFRYDRAGRGGSERPPAPRDAVAMVDDLRTLLDAVGITGPYLLVGHSFGGMLMRIFANRHRSDVAGLVLAESMHARQFDVLGPAFPPSAPSDAPALVGMRRFWTEDWKDPDATPERIDLSRALRQDRAVASFGDLPLHIVTAGSFLREPPMPAPDHERLHGLWVELQTTFLRLSSRAAQTFRRDSGHFVQRDDAGAVVAAIRDVRARSGSS